MINFLGEHIAYLCWKCL